MQRRKTQPVRTPSATYRLQFNHLFPFDQATAIVDYLDELGITDVYASPFLMARPGSVHGYDVTDQTRFNPEIGDEDSFLRLSAALQERKMGLIADVVPNHMCITHPSNVWWWNVIENGPSSRFARFFDIDWHPPKEELANKVLLPFLGDQYGRVLENQEIKVLYVRDQFEAVYYDNPLPLAPWTWTMILEPAAARLRDKVGSSNEHLAELESITTALSHLPGNNETDEAKIHERDREKAIVKRRLSGLIEASPEAAEAIEAVLAEINGRRGDPHSFDRLERLLESEAYRLSFWRVAMDEINYRRFFDINELAAIRVEDSEVFSAVHALIFDLVSRGHITGLRVDHPDGLFEPEKYFRYLQDACLAQSPLAKSNGKSDRNGADRTFYVVAEKILIENEPLRAVWPIEGTTGYTFLNLSNGLFVDHTKAKAFQQLYRRFTGWSQEFDDLVCDSKRLILQVAMSSELNVLARKLDRVSEQHRWYRDFTLESLRDALKEVLAAFPVYRTYIRSDQKEVDSEDRRQIMIAIREAKRRNPAISESVFEFIQNVLLLDHPEGLDDSQRAERHAFALRFQQLSAPVMAKGVEDTAFYRYYPLASLNEVGGNPERFGISLNAFHRRNLIRGELWPNSMNASSTHDTKRGEDVRARINALSEMPSEWYRAIRRWREINRRWKTKVGELTAPDSNEEYLLYQTLLGSWPLLPMNAQQHAAYLQRIQAYMEKAVHEAKLHSSWVSPNVEYEQAVQHFVSQVLEPSADNRFLEDFRQFQGPFAQAGMWNSLSQVVLKIASPGVPDFYQGSELWSFHLVDPDNRQPVDFDRRRKLLSKICEKEDADPAALMDRLMSNPCDGAIKLFITHRALRFRKDHRQLFAAGSYIPLAADGSRSNHVLAFARQWNGQTVIALVGRFFLRIRNSHPAPIGDVWSNAAILLPKRIKSASFQDVFTGQTFTADQHEGEASISLAKVFAHCPVALLFAENPK
ncbi:MAG TPA: malto-oligosyltrehalose synthase [Bryobacteraceae bacterium]|jgi:(1->4)-alpha-D-glucan 1-alpha-D-glucosylmutase|nr:malto-oligosyltrehalose synthase [Bryobacteraceae bacterium]